MIVYDDDSTHHKKEGGIQKKRRMEPAEGVHSLDSPFVCCMRGYHTIHEWNDASGKRRFTTKPHYHYEHHHDDLLFLNIIGCLDYNRTGFWEEERRIRLSNPLTFFAPDDA